MTTARSYSTHWVSVAICSAALLVVAHNGLHAKSIRPNIVLIIADDQDNEHLGFMGHSLVQTPSLDGLAAAGAVFHTMHVPGARCRPTLASFLSGRWPHQSGIYYNVGSRNLDPRGSLPRRLKAAGYATFLGGKFFEGDSQAMGFSHGSGEPITTFVREGQTDLFGFLDEVAGKQPFLVWWAPRLPHRPHDYPAKYGRLYDRQQIPVPEYVAPEARETFLEKEHALLAMTSWLDDGVGELVEKLRAVDQYENTLFVFVIDNGWSNGLPSKGTPFEKGVRTPAFIAWPGTIAAGRRFGHLASGLDLYPTILDYAGIPTSEGTAGRSLRPLLDGTTVESREALFGAVYAAIATTGDERPERDVFALYMRTSRWKYILFVQDVVEAGNERYFRIQSILTEFPARRAGDEDLYDLEADPLEQVDLAGRSEHADRSAVMKEKVLDWWQRTGGHPLAITEAPMPGSERSPDY